MLDVGCGEGADSAYYARRGFAVDAIDGNKGFLKRFRKYCRDERLRRVSIKARDVSTYRYPRKKYDAVSCILVICCMKRSDAERVVKGIRRAVKPGGVVILTSRNYLDPEMKDYSGTDRMIEPNTFCTKDGSCKYLYFVERGRLRELFKGFKILYHREGYAGCKYGEHSRHGDSQIVCRRIT